MFSLPSKRIRLDLVNSSLVLTNGTYLSLFYEFLTIKEILKILTVSKYHADFLNKKKQNVLVKRLISYDYGQIWSYYNNITLPFAGLTNLQFINKLYNDFDFIKNCLFISFGKLNIFSKYILNSYRLEYLKYHATFLWVGQNENFIERALFKSCFTQYIIYLSPLNNYNCIKHWMNKKKVFSLDLMVLFVHLSTFHNFKVYELKEVLNGVIFPSDLAFYNLFTKFDEFKIVFVQECINVSVKGYVTNGIKAILLKIKDGNHIITPTFDAIKFLFKIFTLLVMGKYLPSYVGNNLATDLNVIGIFMSSIKDIKTINNSKYVITELLKITSPSYSNVFLSMIQNDYISNQMDFLIFRNKTCRNKIKHFLKDCLVCN